MGSFRLGPLSSKHCSFRLVFAHDSRLLFDSSSVFFTKTTFSHVKPSQISLIFCFINLHNKRNQTSNILLQYSSFSRALQRSHILQSLHKNSINQSYSTPFSIIHFPHSPLTLSRFSRAMRWSPSSLRVVLLLVVAATAAAAADSKRVSWDDYLPTARQANSTTAPGDVASLFFAVFHHENYCRIILQFEWCIH